MPRPRKILIEQQIRPCSVVVEPIDTPLTRGDKHSEIGVDVEDKDVVSSIIQKLLTSISDNDMHQEHSEVMAETTVTPAVSTDAILEGIHVQTPASFEINDIAEMNKNSNGKVNSDAVFDTYGGADGDHTQYPGPQKSSDDAVGSLERNCPESKGELAEIETEVVNEVCSPKKSSRRSTRHGNGHVNKQKISSPQPQVDERYKVEREKGRRVAPTPTQAKQTDRNDPKKSRKPMGLTHQSSRKSIETQSHFLAPASTIRSPWRSSEMPKQISDGDSLHVEAFSTEEHFSSGASSSRMGFTATAKRQDLARVQSELYEENEDNCSHRWLTGAATSKSAWHRPMPKQGYTATNTSYIIENNTKKRPLPPVFTSSDLPLKRPMAKKVLPSISYNDNLIHNEGCNTSFFFEPVTPVRSGPSHAFCCTNNAIISHPQVPSLLPHATATESGHACLQDMSTEDIKTRASNSLYELVNDTPYSDTHPTAPSDKKNNASSSKRLDDNFTPLSFDGFNPIKDLSTGTVDAETLAKFAEYTSSMRRDLKQNYKKLSSLMKDFNAEILKQHRERSQTSDSSNEGAGEQDGGGTCTLM